MDPAKIDSLEDLESLLELMGRYGLSELEIESEGRRIRLRKPELSHSVMPAMSFPAVASALQASTLPAGMSPGGGPAAKPASNLHEVTSPMVGTFYRAASPEADPFVKEGDRVEEGTVLCLIEAMKVMNEIPAGITGVMKEILVKNGESVEYGQPIFRIALE